MSYTVTVHLQIEADSETDAFVAALNTVRPDPLVRVVRFTRATPGTVDVPIEASDRLVVVPEPCADCGHDRMHHALSSLARLTRRDVPCPCTIPSCVCGNFQPPDQETP